MSDRNQAGKLHVSRNKICICTPPTPIRCSLWSFPFSVPSAAPPLLEAGEAKPGAPAVTTSSLLLPHLPTPTAAQKAGELRARETRGSQRGESTQRQPQQGSGWSAARGEKSSPHHGGCGATVRPRKVSVVFRRGMFSLEYDSGHNYVTLE